MLKSKELRSKINEKIAWAQEQEVATVSEFYFEKARKIFEAYEKWKAPTDRPNLASEILEESRNFAANGKFSGFLARYPEGSPEHELVLLIGRFVAHADYNGFNKNLWNEYPDKRVYAKAGVRQNLWLENLLRYKIGAPLDDIANSVANAIRFKKNPAKEITMLSANHRSALSESLFGDRGGGSDVAKKVHELFDELKLQCKNPENRGFLISKILYLDEIKAQWDPEEEKKAKSKDPARPDIPTTKAPRNLILYGPPGTSKTYSVVDRCLEIIDAKKYLKLVNDPESRQEAEKAFDELCANNRIVFATFHQSYSYEDFIEGFRPVPDSTGNGTLHFDPMPGVFRSLCERARRVSGQSRKFDIPKGQRFRKMSLGDTQGGEEDVFDYCVKEGRVALGWGGPVDYSKAESRKEIQDLYEQGNDETPGFGAEAIARLKLTVQNGDLVVISDGNMKARAIARITGDYFYDPDSPIEYSHFRNAEWLYTGESVPVQKILKDKVFSQQAIYSFNPDDLNMDGIEELLGGQKSEPGNYVMIIDEINRGNISKIFGELITLIEDDKRIKADGTGLQVTLPYSKTRFGVPENVYIIGTMNTADRSIALLDAALRRRFDFEEVPPSPELLDPIEVKGAPELSLSRMLSVMNERIELLFDRDHAIGHAYFLALGKNPEFAGIKKVFLNKIIPLLREYFHDDWPRIRAVLNENAKREPREQMIRARPADGATMGPLSDFASESKIWEVNPDFGPAALVKIYE